VKSFSYRLNAWTVLGSGRQHWARTGPMTIGRCAAARRAWC